MKVFISYGWPEGKWHARLFIKALNKAGYSITSLWEEADIIIAHSAGCYMLKPKLEGKLIILIGLPNWPDKSVYRSTVQKVDLESKNTYWFTKSFLHILYAMKIFSTYKIWRAFRKKYLPMMSDNKVFLVHNEQDTYMNGEISKKLAHNKDWTYRELKGQHDDIWQNPSPYIELINQYFK